MADSAAEPRGLLDQPWMFWLMLAAATLLGAALRLYGLGKPSFWVDEFFTIGRTGTDALHVAQALGYLPSWFTLWLHGADLAHVSLNNIPDWQSLGVSERAARLGPAWVGIASIPILALLARPVFGAGVAGVTALLIAISPWHLYWSQMARFYTTQFLFASAFVLLFAGALRTGRRGTFAAAFGAGVLSLLAHATSIFIVGAVGLALGIGWIVKAPMPHFARGVRWLALLLAAFALITASRELPLVVHGDPHVKLQGPIESPGASSWIADKTRQSWGPPLLELVPSTVLRVEPILFVVGLIWTWVVLRRRDPQGIVIATVAVAVPAGVVLLAVIFPIADRYYFAAFIGWALLAAMWAVEVDRRVTPSAGWFAGSAGALALIAAVGFSAFLYVRDGAGARVRWREAFALIEQQGTPADAVFRNGEGDFEAKYYFHRKLPALGDDGDVAALEPGTWILHRSRGSRKPMHPDLLEVHARYEIPSKPWSWVLYVLRVPAKN